MARKPPALRSAGPAAAAACIAALATAASSGDCTCIKTAALTGVTHSLAQGELTGLRGKWRALVTALVLGWWELRLRPLQRCGGDVAVVAAVAAVTAVVARQRRTW